MTENYTVLARKYRPDTFAKVVGQQHVIDAMKNSILANKLHSVYLLSGTRGVGKTTIARIFTKAMNCENFKEKLEPCDKCNSCKSINEGSSPDLLEVDAASRTKVEETRDLIESIQFPPLFAKYKVFIIDEVHMLTVSSFNALLKTLEEPPEYAKFVLCTTDPQKIPATVLSRCLHFHLKPFTEDQIEKQLTYILQSENIKFDDQAVATLAIEANGSMRDCLSLTDQAIAIGRQKDETIVSKSIVYNMLGLVDDKKPTDLVTSLLRNRYQESINIVNQINEEQPDWSSVLEQMINVLYQLSVAKFITKDDFSNWGIRNSTIKELIEEGSAILQNSEAIEFAYEVFVHAKKMLQVTSNPHQTVLIAVVRVLGFTKELELSLPKGDNGLGHAKQHISVTNTRSSSAYEPSMRVVPLDYKPIKTNTYDDSTDKAQTKAVLKDLTNLTKEKNAKQATELSPFSPLYPPNIATDNQFTSTNNVPDYIEKVSHYNQLEIDAIYTQPRNDNSTMLNLEEITLPSLDSDYDQQSNTNYVDNISISQQVVINSINLPSITSDSNNLPELTNKISLDSTAGKPNRTSESLANTQISIDMTVDPTVETLTLGADEDITSVNMLSIYTNPDRFKNRAIEYFEQRKNKLEPCLEKLIVEVILDRELLINLIQSEHLILDPAVIFQNIYQSIIQNQQVNQLYKILYKDNSDLKEGTEMMVYKLKSYPVAYDQENFYINLSDNTDLAANFQLSVGKDIESIVQSNGFKLVTDYNFANMNNSFILEELITVTTHEIIEQLTTHLNQDLLTHLRPLKEELNLSNGN